MSCDTTRIGHVKDDIPGAVYIGRANGRAGLKASKWANPFRIDTTQSRQEAVTRYRKYLVRNPRFIAELPELRGKALACWCRWDEVMQSASTICHGDVLVWLLEPYTDEELREMLSRQHRASTERHPDDSEGIHSFG